MIKKIKNLLFSENQSVRRTVLKNFTWLFASNVGSRFFKALIVVYATRRLGVTGYGVFSYIIGLAGFFTFFKNVGVDGILTREVAKKPEDQHLFFSTAVWIEVFLLIITAILIIFVAPLFGGKGIVGAISLFPLAALIFIFDDMRDMFVAFLRGKEKMELEALVVVLGNMALTAFGFISIYFWPTPKAYITANASASFVGLLVAAFLVRGFVSGIVKNFKRELVLPILKSALPIAISGVAGGFLFNLDIMMLGWWRTAGDIGLYAAAQKLVGILAIFSGFVAAATFPSLSRFAHSDREKMRVVATGALKIIFIIAIPLFVGGVILRRPLIVFVFGNGYITSANAFAILLFSILALHPLAILSNSLFALDKQARAIKLALVASLTNLGLNFILIPKFGISGASAATTFSFFVYTTLMWHETWNIHKFNLFTELLKPVLAALAMGIITYSINALGIHVLFTIGLSMLLYFSFLYLMKERALEEISLMFRSK